MHLILSLATTILASLVTAAPHPLAAPADANINEGGTVRALDGPQTLKLSVGKAPPGPRRQVRRRDSEPHDAPLLEYDDDLFYTTELQIGSPPQTLTVMADTGSAFLWIVGESCANAVCQATHDVFHESESTTFQTLDSGSFTATYVDGANTTFELVKDTIVWGGYQFTESPFGYVTDLNAQQILFAERNVAGLMGLGWGDGTLTVPHWEQLANKTWENKRFGMYLSRRIDTKNPIDHKPVDGGSLTLNGIDESVIDGQVSYHQLVETNGVAWAIETESVTINGQVVSGHNLPGIIDSGSSLILGPRTLVEDIYRQIPNARYATEEEVGEAGAYFVLPCTSHIDFSVTFGGVEYPIYYRDLLKENNLNGTDLCGGQIQPYDKDRWIFGSPFMKNVYTVHQYDPPAVGFARLTDEANRYFEGTTRTGPGPSRQDTE